MPTLTGTVLLNALAMLPCPAEIRNLPLMLNPSLTFHRFTFPNFKCSHDVANP
jgi:hypothetical protein